MLAGLWHAPESGKSEGEQRLGTSTIGSSEACMLGGLALKRRWSVARKKAGKPADKPNLILGINAQVPCCSKESVYNRSLHVGVSVCFERLEQMLVPG